MATKLDDLKFNDYTLKGATNSSNGYNFSFGPYDKIVDNNNTSVIYSNGIELGANKWAFNGTAAKAEVAYRLKDSSDNDIISSDGCGGWYFYGTSKCADSVGEILYRDGSDNWRLDQADLQYSIYDANGESSIYTLQVDSSGFVKAIPW